MNKLLRTTTIFLIIIGELETFISGFPSASYDEENVDCTSDNDCPLTMSCIEQVCNEPCGVKNPCVAHAECINANHTSNCSCEQGYSGNGFTLCEKLSVDENTNGTESAELEILYPNGTVPTTIEISERYVARINLEPLSSNHSLFVHNCTLKFVSRNEVDNHELKVTDEKGCAIEPTVLSEWEYNDKFSVANLTFPPTVHKGYAAKLDCIVEDDNLIESYPPVNCKGYEDKTASPEIDDEELFN